MTSFETLNVTALRELYKSMTSCLCEDVVVFQRNCSLQTILHTGNECITSCYGVFPRESPVHLTLQNIFHTWCVLITSHVCGLAHEPYDDAIV